MLIDAAAAELAREPEALLQMLGHAQLWQIIGRAYDLSKSQHHPSCFARFWERIKATGSQSRIALAQDGTTQPPSGVMLPRSQLNEFQVKALGEMGGRVVIEDLRPYQNALNQLGAPILTLERLTNLMATAFASHEAGVSEIPDEKVEGFYPMRYNAGSEVYSQTLCQGLAARHEVHVFTREEDPFAPDCRLRKEKDPDDARINLHLVNNPRLKDRQSGSPAWQPL